VFHGAPLAKRPKGRWFISSCLALLFVSLGYSLWNELWHYQAHGVVDARIVQLAAPAAARVASVHVREGHEVRMGDLLVTLDRPELLQQIDRTRDELRVALATVASETIRGTREGDAQVARQRGLLADYFRFRTQLIEAETSWQEHSDELARQRGLVARGAAAAADIDRLSTQMSGLQETIDQLREAVDGLQPDQSPAGQPPAVDPMVGPQLAHVDELRRELGRLREELSLCELRASCDGLVVRQYRYAGETVAAAEPIVELAEKGSEHIALYVPQRLATKLQIGSEVNLNIVALRSQLPCRVWRFDPALQPAPAGLARYYNQNERLVVVRLVPDLRSDADAVWQGVWLGSHVRWPRSWDHPFSAPARVAEPGASRLTAAAPEGLGR
jgi:multidrug resistance efflux pump